MTLKVLVPLDGSEASFRALAGALQILHGRAGVHMTLFNVVSEGMEHAPDEMVDEFDIDEDDEIFPNQASAERMLVRAESLCREKDVPSTKRVVTGRLLDSILAACTDHDLLVMHALDRRQMSETLRGSNTERIARRAGIDVLLVQAAGQGA